jgi:Fur family ferric uptake transcriptional regulator
LLLSALRARAGFVSAQELHTGLLSAGSPVGLTTIYRRLPELARDGLVDVVRDERGERLYRLRPGDEHCHYLFCRACGRSVAVESGPVEHWAAAVGPSAGFQDVDHVLELHGLCDRCFEPAAGRPAASAVSRRCANVE